MTGKRIRVGVIGVTPGRSWAAVAHLPALQALPDYEVTALSTTKAETATAAAAQFGVPLHFDNHAELVAHPEVDLVCVAVKVPNHLELVTAAIDAGKTVFCEWPLGNGLDEAIAMAAHARRMGVRTAVGLQARAAPAVAYVRDLVRGGFVGEVLSTTLIGSGMNWGPFIERPNAYTADKKNGATLLTIPVGHTVDALCHCLGELSQVAATMALRRRTFTLVETGETVPMSSEDQVVVSGILDAGAVAAIHYRGGISRGTNLLWEINGTEGDLQVTAAGGHAQIFDLALAGGRLSEQGLQPMEVPDKYRWAPAVTAGPAYNVAQAYVRLAADLRDGSRLCPDFDDAVQRHRMIDGIERAASTGQAIRL
jgi:predicted dehydrogenase